QWISELRHTWLELMGLCVWGDVKSSRLGAAAKLRKRLLDLGEGLRSLCADRGWIPQPRERLKNALAGAMNLKERLVQFERCALEMDGGCELAAFSDLAVKLHRLIQERLPALEHAWAVLLDGQLDDVEMAHNADQGG
ncbi:MAG: hypothetical protein ACREUA_06870, partial [Burkholderiales bacterium]